MRKLNPKEKQEIDSVSSLDFIDQLAGYGEDWKRLGRDLFVWSALKQSSLPSPEKIQGLRSALESASKKPAEEKIGAFGELLSLRGEYHSQLKHALSRATTLPPKPRSRRQINARLLGAFRELAHRGEPVLIESVFEAAKLHNQSLGRLRRKLALHEEKESAFFEEAELLGRSWKHWKRRAK